MTTVNATQNTPPSHPASVSGSQQTEGHDSPGASHPENSTMGKISAVLGKIKSAVIDPSLSLMGKGLGKVNDWCRAHPVAATIFGTALAIVSIVGMATGGPAGVIFGGAGLAAGGYLVAKNLRAAISKLKNGPPATAPAVQPPATQDSSAQTPSGPLAIGAAAWEANTLRRTASVKSASSESNKSKRD